MPKLRRISLLVLCLVLLQSVSPLSAAPLLPAMGTPISPPATTPFMITSVRYSTDGSAILVEWNTPPNMTVTNYVVNIKCSSTVNTYDYVGPTVHRYSLPVAIAGMGCHAVQIIANGPVLIPPATQWASFPL